SSNFKGPLQILSGLYYEKRTTRISAFLSFQYQSPAPPGTLFDNFERYAELKQAAAFGEATLSLFDDRLKLVAGTRYFKFDYSLPLEEEPLGVPTANEGRSSSISGNTWKASISYKFNDEFYVYG